VSRRTRRRLVRGLAACAAVLGAALGAMPRAMPTARAQQATFSSRIEAVRVDVLVSARGEPVRGLGPADFEVFDNGVRQNVDLVSFERLPLSVVLALDMSDSVVGAKLIHLREASRLLVGELGSDDRAALVTFNEAVALRAAPTTDMAFVRNAIDAAEPSGATSIFDASFAALTVGEGGGGRGLVILFSDGIDTASWLKRDDVLDIAKRCDAVVYAVSTASSAEDRFVRALTDQTGGRRLSVASTKDLGAAFLEMLNEFRQRYVISYSPAGVARDGWHRLTVRVKNRNVTVRARPGYLAQF
jgi:VWFA-related protein